MCCGAYAGLCAAYAGLCAAYAGAVPLRWGPRRIVRGCAACAGLCGAVRAALCASTYAIG